MRFFEFDGRIGKDAEVMSTKTGKNYVRFSVANNTFVNGAEKTDWFDVSCYDPYVVENRVKFLTKGKYVIVHGSLNTEVVVKEDGKVWLNQYVRATEIDTPSLGAKKEDEQETVSTGLGTTNVQQKSYVATSSSNSVVEDDGGDLPF